MVSSLHPVSAITLSPPYTDVETLCCSLACSIKCRSYSFNTPRPCSQLDNAGDFLKNGAASVGLVAPLFPPAAIANKDWDLIKANAEKVIAGVKEAGPLKR